MKRNLDHIYPLQDNFVAESSLDITKWSTYGSLATSFSPSYGLGLNDNVDDGGIMSSASFGGGYIATVYGDLRAPNTSSAVNRLTFQAGASGVGTAPVAGIEAFINGTNLTTFGPGYSNGSSLYIALSDNSMHLFSLARDGLGNAYAWDDARSITNRANPSAGSYHLRLDTYLASSTAQWIKVRPWIVHEPVVSAPNIPPTSLLYEASGNGVSRIDTVTGRLVDTFIKAGTGGLGTPGAVAVGPDGNVYVVDLTNNCVRVYTGWTGAYRQTISSASLSGPRGLAFGPDGYLYVSTSGNSVLSFNPTTGTFIGTFLSYGFTSLGSFQQLAFGPDGNLYIAYTSNLGLGNGAIMRYNGTTGAPMRGVGQVSPIFANSATMNNPTSFTFEPNGSLDVMSTGGPLERYNGTTGQFMQTIAPAGSNFQ